MNAKLGLIFGVAFLTTSVIASQRLIAVGETQKQLFDPIERYRLEVVNNSSGLVGYKTDVSQVLGELVNSLDDDARIFSTITFSEALSPLKVQQLVSSYGLDVKHTHIRTLEPNGLRGTLFINTAATGEIISEEVIGQIEENSNASFVGVIELVAEVPAAQAIALNLDGSVYLVDPSADSRLVENPTEDYMPGLFWQLEEKGIIPQLGI